MEGLTPEFDAEVLTKLMIDRDITAWRLVYVNGLHNVARTNVTIHGRGHFQCDLLKGYFIRITTLMVLIPCSQFYTWYQCWNIHLLFFKKKKNLQQVTG